MEYTKNEQDQIDRLTGLYRQVADGTPNPFIARTLVNTFNHLPVTTKIKLLQDKAPKFYEFCRENDSTDEQVWSNYVGLTSFFNSAEAAHFMFVHNSYDEDNVPAFEMYVNKDTMNQIEPIFRP